MNDLAISNLILFVVALIIGYALRAKEEKAGEKTTIKVYPCGQELNKEQPDMLKNGWMVDSVTIGGCFSFRMMEDNRGPGTCIIVTYKRISK